MIDVRLVDEEGTPMSTPTSSDADDSGNEVFGGGCEKIYYIYDISGGF